MKIRFYNFSILLKLNKLLKMYKLFFILFIICLYARFNIFTYITEKHGHTEVKLTRLVEKCCLKLAKFKLDIKFLITCKRKNLIPVFVKPKLAINVNQKTRNKIMNTLIEAELKNKYKEKKRLTQELKENKSILYSKLSFISKILMNYKLRKTLKGKYKKWSTTHKED